MTPTAHTKSDGDVLREIDQRTARMEAALFGANDGDEGFVQRTNASLTNHGTRLTRVEIAIATATGGLMLLGFLVGHHILSKLP